jgi:hypothetical protein
MPIDNPNTQNQIDPNSRIDPLAVLFAQAQAEQGGGQVPASSPPALNTGQGAGPGVNPLTLATLASQVGGAGVGPDLSQQFVNFPNHPRISGAINSALSGLQYSSMPPNERMMMIRSLELNQQAFLRAVELAQAKQADIAGRQQQFGIEQARTTEQERHNRAQEAFETSPEGIARGDLGKLYGLYRLRGDPRADTVKSILDEEAATKVKPPKISYDQGYPVSVTVGPNEYSVHDPNLPNEAKPLVASAQTAAKNHEDVQTHMWQTRFDAFIKARDEQAAANEVRKATGQAIDTEKNYLRMQDVYRDIRKQGKGNINGPESMVLLSSHIAMTFGGVPGVRTGEELIQAHLKARDLPQDVDVVRVDPVARKVSQPYRYFNAA